MRQNPYLFLLIFSLIVLSVDFYAFRGVKKLLAGNSKTLFRIIWLAFWIVPVFLLLGMLLFNLFSQSINPSHLMKNAHYLSGPFILFYVPKLVFILFNFLDDVVLLLKNISDRFSRKKTETSSSENKLTRAQFLTRAGIILAGIPFASIAYGIQWGRFDFTIRRLNLPSAKLPAAFDGLKIVQISDFHIGSFLNNKDQVRQIVDLINQQNADLILFTGDMVNHVATEMEGFVEILKPMKAIIGKYSILGNHDYGDYARFSRKSEKEQNFEKLLSLQKEVGWDLLLNDSRKIRLAGAEIELLGVENWGLPPFPQYGKLVKAMADTGQDTFKILMSHDPSHWSEEVLQKTDIDLTLSGHTHGAQFGIEIPDWRWSPVNVRYEHWGGLYNRNGQNLYVNTGIGFIGFPGRVGMPPEITVIELKRA